MIRLSGCHVPPLTLPVGDATRIHLPPTVLQRQPLERFDDSPHHPRRDDQGNHAPHRVSDRVQVVHSLDHSSSSMCGKSATSIGANIGFVKNA